MWLHRPCPAPPPHIVRKVQSTSQCPRVTCIRVMSGSPAIPERARQQPLDNVCVVALGNVPRCFERCALQVVPFWPSTTEPCAARELEASLVGRPQSANRFWRLQQFRLSGKQKQPIARYSWSSKTCSHQGRAASAASRYGGHTSNTCCVPLVM